MDGEPSERMKCLASKVLSLVKALVEVAMEVANMFYAPPHAHIKEVCPVAW